MTNKEKIINLNGRRIWQQAAGDSNRNYVSICLKWNVILNGPGYAGPYPECRERLSDDGITSKKLTDLHRFSKEMSNGDIVVLRIGTNQVFGVGEIVGYYQYSNFFSDVDGWDLQHVRRVKWIWCNEKSPKEFDTYDLKLGDTTQELDSEVVENWLRTLEVNADFQPIEEIPKEGSIISIEDIIEYLFDSGIPIASIKHLKEEILDLVTIASWYNRNNTKPSEFETLSYLAIPLLRALGWSPQKMAIEWNNVDIALFRDLPRENEKLCIVVEGEKKGASCLTALSQAKTYAELPGREDCRFLVVTDGLRYGLFEKNENGFSEKMRAYFNLPEFRKNYPIYDCDGIQEGIRLLAP